MVREGMTEWWHTQKSRRPRGGSAKRRPGEVSAFSDKGGRCEIEVGAISDRARVGLGRVCLAQNWCPLWIRAQLLAQNRSRTFNRA